jgi:hypothetical protein
MTNVPPNNDILPSEWLVEAVKTSEIQFKGVVDLYDTDPKKLAELVDKFINEYDVDAEKEKAFSLGYNTFSPDVLKDKYLSIIE